MVNEPKLTRRSFLKYLGGSVAAAVAAAFATGHYVPIAQAIHVSSYVQPRTVLTELSIIKTFVTLYLDDDGKTAIVVDKYMRPQTITQNHQEALQKAIALAKGNILNIGPGTYNFTEISLENIIIYATPLVTLNGTLKIIGDVYIFGYPKVKKVDTSQADSNNREYYLETDILT